MLRRMRSLLRCLAISTCVIVESSVAACLAQSPHIFYTDLLSGPATGGQSDHGAFVTLYGAGFGSVRAASFVTVGGAEVSAYPLWSDKRVTVQLGKAAQTGAIVLHLASNKSSNDVSFTVRPGHIYFVARDGNDGNKGSFTKPWKTLVTAKNALQPGDIAYAMDGVDAVALDKYDSALSIQTSGRQGAPLAIVAYPGARVTIGSFSGPQIAARTPNIARSSDHWVLAGLVFKGEQEALDVTASTDWRIIGNDFSCPNGFGPTGCIETSQANSIAFLGNTVHDVAQPGTTKAYHAVYFSTDSNHIDVGWNIIQNVHSCRALQFHSSPLDEGTGLNQYDLHVHDNIIHDVVCDAINFATIDPSKGPVEAFNNLIYNAGTGPDPEDGGADYACIYVQGGANRGSPGKGAVSIFNNTMDNCGARGNSDSGAISLSSGSPEQKVQLRNNIIVLSRGEPLLSAESIGSPLLSQTNILWAPPGSAKIAHRYPASQFLLRDPLLEDPAHGDFSLRKGSPAIAAGTPSGPAFDLRGTSRPADNFDIGALQHKPVSAEPDLTRATAAPTGPDAARALPLAGRQSAPQPGPR